MRILWTAVLSFGSALLLASCATGGDREQQRYNRVLGKPVANPSEIVRAELSFARLAQEKGQWTAFRQTAADDAIMFAPGLVNAQQWLKGKADPAQSVDWQPHKIYMSCDGSMAVSTGAWQNAKGGTGYFTTIWRQDNFGNRKPGKGPEWKWVFDHGAPLDTPIAEPDFVETEVAPCKGDADPSSLTGFQIQGARAAQSNDGSLAWTAAMDGDGGHILQAYLWDGSAYTNIVTNKVDQAAK